MRRRLAVACVALATLLLSGVSIAAAQTVPEDAYGAGVGVAGAQALPVTGNGPTEQQINPFVAAALLSFGTTLGAAIVVRRRRKAVRS